MAHFADREMINEELQIFEGWSYCTFQFSVNSFRQILFCPGEFNFVSYDERLEDYLDSLELNGRELGPVFRSAQVPNKLLEVSRSIMPNVNMSNPKRFVW